jgi:hypothetical protein
MPSSVTPHPEQSAAGASSKGAPVPVQLKIALQARRATDCLAASQGRSSEGTPK